MISLTRVRDKDLIPSSFRGKTPINRAVKTFKKVQQLLEDEKEIKVSFDSLWSITKKQLLEESNDKCAYCESPTTVVAFGDVEHYRPKSKYWWLAYVYDNYLPSCTICNQRFKVANFEHVNQMLQAPDVQVEMTEEELRVLAKVSLPDPLDLAAINEFEDAHRAENPSLLNPYIDDPEEFFAWEFIQMFDGDEDISEVHLVAANDHEDTERYVDAAIRICGLNRPELLRARFDMFKQYVVWFQALQSPAFSGDLAKTIQEMFDSLSKPDSAYAAMVRYFEKERNAGNFDIMSVHFSP